MATPFRGDGSSGRQHVAPGGELIAADTAQFPFALVAKGHHGKDDQGQEKEAAGKAEESRRRAVALGKQNRRRDNCEAVGRGKEEADDRAGNGVAFCRIDGLVHPVRDAGDEVLQENGSH